MFHVTNVTCNSTNVTSSTIALKLFEAGEKGFRDQLAVIYKACDHANVRRAMFSATLAPDVEKWCKLNLDNVCTVTIGARNSATNTVEQKLVYTGTEKGKMLALKQVIGEGLKPPVLMFVQSKERAQELHKELVKEQLKVDTIHSGRSQLQRDDAVKAFRSGRVWVLICTELLSRGIDFKGVNLVINYDFPPSTVSYIHRIGRTGRAGRNGKAITFFTDEDKVLLRSIAQVVKDSGSEVPEYMLKLKKASRQEKRKLAKNAVKRENIIKESKYDKAKRLKKEEMIAGSKRRKRKLELKQEQEVTSSSQVTSSSPAEKKRKVEKKNKGAGSETALANSENDGASGKENIVKKQKKKKKNKSSSETTVANSENVKGNILKKKKEKKSSKVLGTKLQLTNKQKKKRSKTNA